MQSAASPKAALKSRDFGADTYGDHTHPRLNPFGSARAELCAGARRARTISFMSYRATQHTSRREIDVAVGILVGLRGCSERAAFDELVGVVHDTGIGIGGIATGLVALASGASSAGHDAAFAAWGELIGGRRAASVPVTS
jgi:hypothetical protein